MGLLNILPDINSLLQNRTQSFAEMRENFSFFRGKSVLIDKPGELIFLVGRGAQACTGSCSVTSRIPRPTEESLPDDKKKPGGQDRTGINISEEYEVKDWSKKFGSRRTS